MNPIIRVAIPHPLVNPFFMDRRRRDNGLRGFTNDVELNQRVESNRNPREGILQVPIFEEYSNANRYDGWTSIRLD